MRIRLTQVLIFLLYLGMTTAAVAQAGASAGPLNTVESIHYATLAGGRMIVRISFSREIKERPRVISMHAPQASIALDFAASASNLPKNPIEINERELRYIAVVPGGDRLRVVLNLRRPLPHAVEIDGRDAFVTLHRPVAVDVRGL